MSLGLALSEIENASAASTISLELDVWSSIHACIDGSDGAENGVA